MSALTLSAVLCGLSALALILCRLWKRRFRRRWRERMHEAFPGREDRP